MNHIDTLQALLNDVKGNEFLGDAKKISGYLKSLSLLADAMSRSSWQQFELDVVGELKALNAGPEVTRGLETKVQLAQRELELADLQVKLMDFHCCAASSAFMSKEDAAKSLRKIADQIEAADSKLFPKPWTEEDVKAYTNQIGAEYIEDEGKVEDFLNRMKNQSKDKVRVQPKAGKIKEKR
ncbi:hypothetical protein [Rhodoferax ferrireducens]|uniref:hypothetical protein n=1 Tax=Rhodoferax ferrireducens TaxID=192843 RepID=UPI000E0DA33B|nr:hypothetical protein [Rhodoferax ferrireducens]